MTADQPTPDPKHLLSARQRRVLWLLSQGEGMEQVALTLRTHRTSVRDSAVSARRKLSCRTTLQAVLRAYQLGVIGPWEDCGSRLAYVRHQDKDEDPCPACRIANRIWVAESAQPPAQPIRPTDAQVRLLRAFHAGRTYDDIMQAWDISRAKLHREVSDVYRRLGVSAVPRDERRAAALRVAQGMGLLRRGPVTQTSPTSQTQPLSDLEVQTLRTLAEGHTIGKAAAVLGVPRTTVSSRLHIIYRKTGVLDVHPHNRRRACFKAAREQGYPV